MSKIAMIIAVGCHILAMVFIYGSFVLISGYIREFIIAALALGSSLFISNLIGNLLCSSLGRIRLSSENKAVFITGCDTGFGHMLAKRLDKLGFNVFAGCLFPSGEGAANLQATSSNRLKVIDLDVTKDESVQNAVNVIKNSLGNLKLWTVVNNAGVIKRGELEWTALDDIKLQIEVNALGMVRVTKAFLPLLRESRGRMVATTSFAGRYSFPYFAGYCMSKHAATSFCDALRLELQKWRIKVVTVEPFAYKSPMTETSNVLKDLDQAWAKVPQELKNIYGSAYIDIFKESTVKFNEFSSTPRPNEVIDCLEEAITAVSPRYTYTPGDMKSTVGFWIIRRLHPFWANLIVKRCVMQDIDVDGYIRGNRSKTRNEKST